MQNTDHISQGPFKERILSPDCKSSSVGGLQYVKRNQKWQANCIKDQIQRAFCVRHFNEGAK